MTIADLIERLEKEGPSRELDLALHMEFGKGEKCRNGDGIPLLEWSTGECPHYTSSIDSALTLVPEGCYGRFEPRFWDPDSKQRVTYRAYVIRPMWDRWVPVDDSWFEHTQSGDQNTPAVAICVAALLARAGGVE